jgi:oligopeptidase B
VVISCTSRTLRQELVVDAHDPDAAAVPLRPRRPGIEDVAEHQRVPGGDRWLLVTNDGAAEFRMLASAGADWVELVPARRDERLESCQAFAGGLVLGWRRHGRPVVELRDPDASLGSAVEVAVPPSPNADPGAWTVRLGPNPDYHAVAVVVETTSFVHPAAFLLVPFGPAAGAGPHRVIHRQEAPHHDPERYVTRRISVPARDGTEIPVTLAHRADLDPRAAGGAPALYTGYGSYEACDWPEFDRALPVWLDQGLVFARAHIRGGGEGGRNWWLQARMHAKATTFTDYVDVADALVEQGWLAADRIASRGLSAGGLLQGAVLSMRPDRWAAVVAEVPFVDCVNSMLDDSLPLTVGEWEEWGDPRDPADYAAMRGYTPYENLPVPPPGGLPAILVTGAVHDPRVLVHEPAKWVAALRSALDGAESVLFRVETGAGAHAGPAGRFAYLDYEAEVMAFVLEALQV